MPTRQTRLLIALFALVTLTGCRSGTNSEAPASPTADPAPTAPAPAPAQPVTGPPSTAQQAHVEGSGAGDPSAPARLETPRPVEVASHSLAPVRCVVEGAPLRGNVGFEVVRSVAAFGDRVWLVDADANLRRYTAAVGADTCSLTPDSGFGTNGVFDGPRDLVTLSVDTNGRLLASSGIFETWIFSPGAAQPSATCADPGHGYLSVSPDGSFALGRFLGRDIRRVDFAADACTGADWPHAPVFANVQAIGYAHGLTIVGGLSAEESPSGRVTQLLALRGELPAWRQGGVGDAFAEDAYSWIHAIHPCGADVCVLDANARALHVVDPSGTHLARVDVGPLFGHTQPVVSAMAVAADGTGWFAVAEERAPDAASFDAYVYRLPAL